MDVYILMIGLFQSTHPHGVRLGQNAQASLLSRFQSTHPHGVRPPESAKAIISKMFQSTHPHGVRRIPRPHRPYKTRFQSTHPHGVRRDSFGGAFNDIAVSIHAPTRGATRGRISGIHVHYTFQSTHPHGVRPIYSANLMSLSFVSIHAPTRGATRGAFPEAAHDARFQSTHPHGVRRQRFCWGRVKASFNPRTHTGCDIFSNVEVISNIVVSIHAPTRGATLFFLISSFVMIKFQSTHPHGVRLMIVRFIN